MPASTRRRPKAAPTPPPERLTFTIAEAADRLGISVRHVYRLLDAGSLPRSRMGGATRISRAAVEAYAVKGDGPS